MSLASVITTSITKGSFFHKQVERHGFDLTQGDARVILQTIRARDIMTPLDSHDTAGELDEACVYDDDYLGRVMGFFSAEKIDGAQVRSRHATSPLWATSPRPTPMPPTPMRCRPGTRKNIASALVRQTIEDIAAPTLCKRMC